MKKINKIILLMMAVLAVACNSEPTLQSYYVDHQENDNFVVSYSSIKDITVMETCKLNV